MNKQLVDSIINEMKQTNSYKGLLKGQYSVEMIWYDLDSVLKSLGMKVNLKEIIFKEYVMNAKLQEALLDFLNSELVKIKE